MSPNTCSQFECKAVAIWRVFWPGQGPRLMCEEHALKARAVAETMGFYLHIEAFLAPEVQP